MFNLPFGLFFKLKEKNYEQWIQHKTFEKNEQYYNKNKCCCNFLKYNSILDTSYMYITIYKLKM